MAHLRGERESLTVTEIHHEPPEDFEPDAFERQAFEDTILEDQLREAIRRINDPESDWLSDNYIEQIIHRIEQPGPLIFLKQTGTAWLQQGIEFDVGEEEHPTSTIQLIDFSDAVKQHIVAIDNFSATYRAGNRVSQTSSCSLTAYHWLLSTC